MPKNFADIVKLIADKAGIDTTDKSIVDLLSVNATVGDEAFNKIETGLNSLLTFESAKHNAQLSAHFKSQALLPADTEINNILEALGLEDADKAEFASEKSTYKKIGKLVEKVKALESKKASATSGTDKKALTDEIQKLNGQILDLKAQSEAKIKAAQDEANAAILQYAQESLLSGKPFSDSIPEAIRVSSSLQLINKELTAKGAKVIRAADGSLKLIQAANPDLDYMENNKPVGYGEFADKVLSTHAMLKVSDPNKKVPGVTKPIQTPAGGGESPNASVVKANESNLAALEASLG